MTFSCTKTDLHCQGRDASASSWLYHQQKTHFLRDCASIFHLLWRRLVLIRLDLKTQQPDKEHLGRHSWECCAFVVPQIQQVPVRTSKVPVPFAEQFPHSQAAGESLWCAIYVPTTLGSWGAMFNMSLLMLSITACSRGCWIRLGSKRTLLTLFEMYVYPETEEMSGERCEESVFRDFLFLNVLFSNSR